jgi:hypothetical protein
MDIRGWQMFLEVLGNLMLLALHRESNVNHALHVTAVKACTEVSSTDIHMQKSTIDSDAR